MITVEGGASSRSTIEIMNTMSAHTTTTIIHGKDSRFFKFINAIGAVALKNEIQ